MWLQIRTPCGGAGFGSGLAGSTHEKDVFWTCKTKSVLPVHALMFFFIDFIEGLVARSHSLLVFFRYLLYILTHSFIHIHS
jgi:hypothetical protein